MPSISHWRVWGLGVTNVISTNAFDIDFILLHAVTFPDIWKSSLDALPLGIVRVKGIEVYA